jgi:CheY-like chemotaxis protein
MKTDFAILWIDDNPQFVDSLRPPLEKWMEDHGFGLIVHHRKSEAGIFDDLEKREIELIVLDYKLPKKKGDELIGEIRSKNFYQDIIFYSQFGIPNDIFNIPPDGVFFVDKGDAKDRIKDLIGLKIKRASDLATLRGWIVADAIELETILGRVLGKCFKEKEAMFTERVLSEDRLFDFGKKHTVLNGILKDHIADLKKTEPESQVIPKLQVCKEILNLFSKEIIEIRNALAHQMAEIHETGHKKIKTKTREAKEIVITPEQCVTIRKNVRKHLANLLELESLI